MNLKNTLLLAAILGTAATSALAVTPDAHSKVTTAVQFEAPAVKKIVSPTNLSRRHNETVVVKVSLDEKGQPVSVRVLSRGDDLIAPNLVAAISQWEFTPARKNGVAVPSHVVVPISIVEA